MRFRATRGVIVRGSPGTGSKQLVSDESAFPRFREGSTHAPDAERKAHRAFFELFGNLVHDTAEVQGPCREQIPDKLAISNLRLAISSTLRVVLVRTESILGCCHGVVRQPVLIDSVAMRVANLLVGRAVAFDGAFVDVGIVVLLESHGCHVASTFASRPVGLSS